MKKCLFVFCVAACVYFTSLTAMAETITGFLTDENEIITYEGIAYTIENDEKGAELLDFMGMDVEVTGSVKDLEGMKVIKVTRFSLIPVPEEKSAEESEQINDTENWDTENQ